MMAVPPPLMVATTDAAVAVAGYAKSTAVRTATTNKPKDAGIAARATFMCASLFPLACTAPGALGREHAGRIMTIVAYPARGCNRPDTRSFERARVEAAQIVGIRPGRSSQKSHGYWPTAFH